MKIAIGLWSVDLRKGKYNAYRNRFVRSNGEMQEDWEYLISIGYADKRESQTDGWIVYFVTELGFKFLSELLELTITEEN